MKILLYTIGLAALLYACCEKNTASLSANRNKTDALAEDSIAFRKKNIEKWHKKLQADYDSVVSFAFYLQKDYLELKRKLGKYEKLSEQEKLVDQLNDNMFAGGDPCHNFTNFADLGEAGHFFEEAKNELASKKIKYHWDTLKLRYQVSK